MKKQIKKLTLAKETVRSLEPRDLREIATAGTYTSSISDITCNYLSTCCSMDPGCSRAC